MYILLLFIFMTHESLIVKITQTSGKILENTYNGQVLAKNFNRLLHFIRSLDNQIPHNKN